MPNIRPFGGKRPVIHPGAWIDPTALVIGDVTIGRDSSIWPMAVLRGDVHRIRIGAGGRRAGCSTAAATKPVSCGPGGR